LTSLRELHLYDSQISDISALAGLTNLTRLIVHGNEISDITPLSGLTNLTTLTLDNNTIVDISVLSGLTNLGLGDYLGFADLGLSHNQIGDIFPLVQNPGLDAGDTVDLTENPLSEVSLSTHIPELEARGVEVLYTAQGWSVNLVDDWNIFGPAALPDPAYTASTLAADINAQGGTVTEVFWWNAAAGTWPKFTTDPPISRLKWPMPTGLWSLHLLHPEPFCLEWF